MNTPYTKPAISIEDQIKLLYERGLHIENPDETAHFLENIGFNRLAGYWQIFQIDPAQRIFRPGSSFSNIAELYNFDRELRILILDAIERIEVSFRCRLINFMCSVYSPTWFVQTGLFHNEAALRKVLVSVDKELARTEESVIREHNRTYGTVQYPPSWKTFQVLSFGTLSQLYGNIRNDVPEKKRIAQSYGLASSEFLHSWMQAVSILRNLCAHHVRICYRKFSYPPKLMHRPKLPWISREYMPSSTGPLIQLLFLQLCAVRFLLHTVSPGNQFHVKLKELIAKYPSVELNRMGFPEAWEQEDLWK